MIFFQHFQYSPTHCPTRFLIRNQMLTLLQIPCTRITYLLMSFKIFFLTLDFDSLVMMWFAIDFFALVCLEFTELTECTDLCFTKFWWSSDIIFLIYVLPFSLSLLLWGILLCRVRILVISHRSLKLCSFSFHSFSFCFQTG